MVNGFKKTEAGMIPKDWEVAAIGEVSSPKARIGWQNMRKSEFLDSGSFMLITGTDFEDGRINYTTCKYVSEERYNQDPNIQVGNGDILITKDGTLGKVALIRGLSMKATLNAGVFVLRNLSPTVNNEFLYQYLTTNKLMDYARRTSTGGTIQHLNQKVLVNFPIPVPPLAEQRRIAKALGDMDELIAASEEQVRKWQAVKQGCLQHMFPQKGRTEPEMRLSGFTGAWAQRQLGEVFVKSGSGGTPLASQREYYGGGIPFLSISDIDGRGITRTAKTLTKAGLDSSAAWVVPAGAVSLAMYASVGKVGILGMDSATSQAFYNMVFDDDALRDFVYYRLVKADLEQEWEPFISTGTQRNLNAQKVKNFPIQFPTQREEIRVIGLFFRKLDDFVACRQRQVEKYRNLKQGMMEELLSGHTRLTEGDDAQ